MMDENTNFMHDLIEVIRYTQNFMSEIYFFTNEIKKNMHENYFFMHVFFVSRVTTMKSHVKSTRLWMKFIKTCMKLLFPE